MARFKLRQRFAIHPSVERVLKAHAADHPLAVHALRDALQQGHGGTAGSLWPYPPEEQLALVERELAAAVVREDHFSTLQRQPWYVRWGLKAHTRALTPVAERELQDLTRQCQKAAGQVVRVPELPAPVGPPDALSA